MFNIERDGKLHVVFGGTKIVQNSSPSSKTGSIKPPDNGCVGYVLRTGFNTSQVHNDTYMCMVIFAW